MSLVVDMVMALKNQFILSAVLVGFSALIGAGANAQPINDAVPAELSSATIAAPATPVENPDFDDARQKFLNGDAADAEAIWLQIATTPNDSDAIQAQYGLASLYEFGGKGVKEQPLLAAQLYGDACRQGIPDACTNLGVMYSLGRGVAKDEPVAATLWQAASDRGHCLADFNLGLAYYSGKGVDLDRDLAVDKIFNASQCEIPEADYAVCQFYRLGLGLPENLGLALSYCQRASANGNEAAKSVVGDLVVAGVNAIDISTVDRSGKPLSLSDTPPTPTESDRTSAGDSLEAKPTDATRSTADQQPSSAPAPLQAAPNQYSIMFSASNNGSTAEPRQGVNCASIMAQCDEPQAPSTGSVLATAPGLQFDYPLEGEELELSELPIFPSYRPQGVPPRDPIYVLWLGSAETEQQAAQLWQSVAPLVAQVLDDPRPTYLPVIIPAELAFTNQTTVVTRIYLGPIPSVQVGWQVCNVLKLEAPATFCKPWDANSI